MNTNTITNVRISQYLEDGKVGLIVPILSRALIFSLQYFFKIQKGENGASVRTENPNAREWNNVKVYAGLTESKYNFGVPDAVIRNLTYTSMELTF